MKKKVLVTGGAGFVGSHLVDKLIKNGHKVTIVDDLSGGLPHLHPKAQFFQCDIRQFGKLKSIFRQVSPEIVYHLAANAAENKAQFSPVDITSRNFDGAIKVVTAAIPNGLRRFIFTSSIAVYGNGKPPFLESDVPTPEDLYGITKLAFEHCLKVLSEVHQFEYVIVRPHNVYGPRQDMTDPYRNVVTIFMNQILNNQPLVIYGDGTQQRSFSYIDEIAEALLSCLDSTVAGMTFNVGTDKVFTVNQLAEELLKITKSKVKIEHLQMRPREVSVALSDHSLAKKYLNYKESISLAKGLETTWKWAKKQGYQKPRYTKLEINSELVPQNWSKGLKK